MNKEIQIKQGAFVEWYYTYKDELLSVAEMVKSDLKSYGKSQIDLNDLFYNNLGYLPANLILNQEVIKELIFNDELSEEDFKKVKVVWVEE